MASWWVCGRVVSRGHRVHGDFERSATQPLLGRHRCTWDHPGLVELGVFWGVVSPHITSLWKIPSHRCRVNSSRVSSGRASLALTILAIQTGLDLRAQARPEGLDLVHRVLALLWIFYSALEAGGVLGGGEVRGRRYPYSQDCLSILGGSTRRLFSTTINFNGLVFRICFLFESRGPKRKAVKSRRYICTSIDLQSQQAWFSGKWHAGSSSLPALCQNTFHFACRSRSEEPQGWRLKVSLAYRAHIPSFSFDVPPCALQFRRGSLDLPRALEALVGSKKGIYHCRNPAFLAC